jgi:hypothetical protein
LLFASLFSVTFSVFSVHTCFGWCFASRRAHVGQTVESPITSFESPNIRGMGIVTPIYVAGPTVQSPITSSLPNEHGQVSESPNIRGMGIGTPIYVAGSPESPPLTSFDVCVACTERRLPRDCEFLSFHPRHHGVCDQR